MKKETEELPSGKVVRRTFNEDGWMVQESHEHGMDIVYQADYANEEKVAETYLVNGRLVGRARYEKRRADYPDMPEADSSLPDHGAELVKLANREKKQRAALKKELKENPLTDEQLQEAERQIPFFRAAGGGDLGALRQLLEEGEDPNAIAIGQGFTPLYNACFFGGSRPEESLTAVRLLLEYGAAPNLRFEFVSQVSWTVDRGLTALMVASTAAIAEALLDAGAEVNAADERGGTPLMRAAGNGKVDVVRVLTQHHADAEAINQDGQTAADLAESKLEFFTDSIEGLVPEKRGERIAAYQEILRLIESR